MHDLGGITSRIGGNGKLPLFIDLTSRKRGQNGFKAKRGKYTVPKGQKLIHSQGHGQPDASPTIFARGKRREIVTLKFMKIGKDPFRFQAGTFFALITRNKALLVAKIVDSQMTMIGASLTKNRLGSMNKALQFFG